MMKGGAEHYQSGATYLLFIEQQSNPILVLAKKCVKKDQEFCLEVFQVFKRLRRAPAPQRGAQG